jgi:hypothetical protein
MSAGGFYPSQGPIVLPAYTAHNPHSADTWSGRYAGTWDHDYLDDFVYVRRYGLTHRRFLGHSFLVFFLVDMIFVVVGGLISAVSHVLGGLLSSKPSAARWSAAGGGLYGLPRFSGRSAQALAALQSHDPAWNERALIEGAAHSFVRIQEAWTKSDLPMLSRMLMPELFQQWRSKLEEDRLRCVRNLVSELKVSSVRVVDFEDSVHNDCDRFTVLIVAQGWDRVVTFSGHVVVESRSPFVQHWTFRRQGREFRLEQITPAATALRQAG